MGEMVEFPSNGQTAQGYLATPSSGSGPGVVVIQEWWGLVPHIKDVCDRYAREGFTALAVDLYHGASAGNQEPDEAGKLMMELDVPRAAKEMGGAVQWLLRSDKATGDGLGVVGYCMGGGLALYLATLRPEVRATVAYYGVIPWEGVKPDWSKLNGPLQGHWGRRDDFNPTEQVEALEKAVRDAGKPVEFFWYDAEHAFFNDTRAEAHEPEAARLAWQRTLAFFRQNLGADR
jgi:carboxymethylenebutenolidase